MSWKRIDKFECDDVFNLTFSSEFGHDWKLCEDLPPELAVGFYFVQDAALIKWQVSVLRDRLNDLLE